MDNEKDLSSFISKLHNNAPNTENATAQTPSAPAQPLSEEFDCVVKEKNVNFADSVSIINQEQEQRVFFFIVSYLITVAIFYYQMSYNSRESHANKGLERVRLEQ